MRLRPTHQEESKVTALDRYEPPGRLVTVDGSRVHIVDAAAGGPTTCSLGYTVSGLPEWETTRRLTPR